MGHTLSHLKPTTVQYLLERADFHAMEFLTRLEHQVNEYGVDGVVVRNQFEAGILRETLRLLREERDEL